MDEDEVDSRTLGLSSVLPRNSNAFDPTFSGPRDVDRDFTDRGSFVLFCFFIGSVGAIAANAFLFGPGELEKLPRVFASNGKACGTDDYASKTSVLVWWPREETVFPGTHLRVCSDFCPKAGSRVCLSAEEIVIETKGTAISPDPLCATDALEWETSTLQRFGRCFTDVDSCDEQTSYEIAELDQISTMDVAIRALLDMWHSRWPILAVGCVIPVLFSCLLVRWLARPRNAKDAFGIAWPQITLSLLLAALPAVSLQVLDQELKGFFECFYVDKFLMPAVTYLALAILAMAIIMAIASFLLRKKLKVCSKLAIETARCLKVISGAQNVVMMSCLASCSVAVGWFGMGSYVLCWALDLEARDKINANLRTFILVLFSVGCLWLVAFVGAVTRLTLSGAVSDWFWQHRPKDTKNSVRSSFLRTTTKHPGTAAKGSLLITVFSFWRVTFSIFFGPIRVLFAYANLLKKIVVTIVLSRKVDRVVDISDNGDRKAQKKKQGRPANVYIISRRAYNSVALHGRGLIDSGLMTRKILRENAFGVGKCYNLMGEINILVSFLILVLGLCLSVLASAMFEQPNGLGKGSESPLGVILCVKLTFFTAVQGAFAPFHQSTTALVQCFCEDLDRNDGSPVNPYRAHKGLRELVSNEHEDAYNTNKKNASETSIIFLKERHASGGQESSGKVGGKVKRARDFFVNKVLGMVRSENKDDEEGSATRDTAV